MYKKQMSLQKVLCLLAIAISVIVFIYALGIETDLYDSLYSTMRNPNDLTKTNVSGSYVYYEMQDFNRALLVASIGMILLSALLFVTNTHCRRRYYIGNYVSTCLFAGASVALTVWGHKEIGYYRSQFLAIDFEALAKHAKAMKSLYTESTFWFDIHAYIFALLILVAVLLLANMVWKIILMKQEKALLEKA